MDKINPLEEAIRNDGIIGAGDPAYLVSSRLNKKVASLPEAKRDMYLAQEKLVKIINNILYDDYINYEDRFALTEVSIALTKGINFLEHVEKILETLTKV